MASETGSKVVFRNVLLRRERFSESFPSAAGDCKSCPPPPPFADLGSIVG